MSSSTKLLDFEILKEYYNEAMVGILTFMKKCGCEHCKHYYQVFK